MAILTFLAILVALFGKEFISNIKKPVIKPSFDEDDVGDLHESLYPLFKHGGRELYSRGMKCLLKISNEKRNILGFIKSDLARSCEVKVSYVKHKDNIFPYSPSYLKWSECDSGNQVSIMPGSYHYLEFIDIYNFKNDLWMDDPRYPMGIIKSKITPDSQLAEWNPPSEKLFFKFCMLRDDNEKPNCFFNSGIYEIYILVSAENSDPYEYVVELSWDRGEWNKVDISLSEIDK